MFIRPFISAAATTILVAIPLYFIVRPDNAFPVTYPALLAAAFMTALLSGALTLCRIPRRRKAGRTDRLRETGTVKWFNTAKGYGFITRDSGEDVFVHFRSIRGSGHRSIKEGQRVEFTVSQAEKGPQADDVTGT